MLSNHSFNALLKTLEEPPPHIKFLLATTDPQKLPLTVLSRCLQFNLKRLTVAEIGLQLEKICREEGFAAESEGLKSLARAADGSMRDGLSLLDQAIAFSAGDVTADAVGAMLGSIDRQHVVRFVQALAANDGSALLDEVAALDEQAPDYRAVLDELMGVLQRIAVLQLVGSESDEDAKELPELATAMSAEDVQLYYQIALQGQRDLGVCRDYRSAFEMTLLRMLAFRPDSGDAPQSGRKAQAIPTGNHEASRTGPETRRKREGSAAAGGNGGTSAAADATATSAVAVATSAPAAADATSAQPDLPVSSPEDWQRLLAEAEVSGASRQLAEHCAVKRFSRSRLELVLASENAHLNTERVRSRLSEQLSNRFSGPVSLAIEVGEPSAATPAQIRAAGESERMRKARTSIENDPIVKEIQATFDSVLESESINPKESGQG